MQKLLLSICLLLVTLTGAEAQKGLFLKFSVGPGLTTEYSNINNSFLSIVTKNHAIGWGITENLAVQVGEFGGLNKQKIGDYEYINLDVFGAGICYRTPLDIKISTIVGYGKVSYARKWYKSLGDSGGKGYGINLSVDKEWFPATKWGIRVGPQISWMKTTDTNYKFFNVSFNAGVVFYLNKR